MTFWKNFFYKNKKNNIYNKIKSKKKKIEDLLLVENLKANNQNINIYFSTKNNIDLYELEKLCDSVGWVRRPLQKVKLALENSFMIGYMFYYDNNKRKVIGFARATSDNAFNATIWDVVIHPKFQKKGLGKALMNQIIYNLRMYDISTITLFADPQVIKFYRNLGFITDPDGVKGMFWYPM
uniref:N-acetyltransferase domain-containing protein n=1 Tax=Sphondylothamnion multifidum TaxID=193186 RepID=A0A4D6WZT7_9FLOR|nr:hypothetical protein [Sphondylothamnion multifidum]